MAKEEKPYYIFNKHKQLIYVLTSKESVQELFKSLGYQGILHASTEHHLVSIQGFYIARKNLFPVMKTEMTVKDYELKFCL